MATSLRNTVSSEIGTFLLNNGFSLRNPDKNPILVDELVSIVNSLSDFADDADFLLCCLLVPQISRNSTDFCPMRAGISQMKRKHPTPIFFWGGKKISVTLAPC